MVCITKAKSHMGAIYTSYTFAFIFITDSPWLRDESVLVCHNLFSIKPC